MILSLGTYASYLLVWREGPPVEKKALYTRCNMSCSCLVGGNVVRARSWFTKHGSPLCLGTFELQQLKPIRQPTSNLDVRPVASSRSTIPGQLFIDARSNRPAG